jgi:hypothetical protein
MTTDKRSIEMLGYLFVRERGHMETTSRQSRL